MYETKRLAHWRLQTIKSNSLHGNKWSKASFVRFTCCPWTMGGVDLTRLRVSASTSEQNPRLTAKAMTATQNCNPKQTDASEGAMNFLCKSPRTHNLKLQAQASARRLPKHSWNQPANDQCSNNRSGAQYHGIEGSKSAVRIAFIARTR